MNPNDIHVKLEHFDGPLGLLLMLIQKEEMSIRELNIGQITKQYLDYVQRMREINFDIAGEYLYMAATLLYLKSKSCLGEEEAERMLSEHGLEAGIQTKAELVRRLEELQRFQELGSRLWELPKLGHEVFTKPKIKRKAIIDSFLSPIELEKLVDTMLDFLTRESRKYKVIKRERMTIKEKLVFLKDLLDQGESKRFAQLLQLEDDGVITDKIITFISLLELARLKKVRLFQNDYQQEIFIEVIESLRNFDVDLVDEVEDEATQQEAAVIPIQ